MKYGNWGVDNFRYIKIFVGNRVFKLWSTEQVGKGFKKYQSGIRETFLEDKKVQDLVTLWALEMKKPNKYTNTKRVWSFLTQNKRIEERYIQEGK